MASIMKFSAVVILAFLPYFIAGETCTSPQVTSEVYTTNEATMSYETVVIIEFSLTCKNKVKNVNLYADFNGKTYPTSRVEGSNKYQVSFSGEHKKIPSGTYDVKFYDEEGYSALRKAQRNEESTSNIASLFSVSVSHRGASSGAWVQSEFVATIVAGLVWYLAYNTRNKLEN